MASGAKYAGAAQFNYALLILFFKSFGLPLTFVQAASSHVEDLLPCDHLGTIAPTTPNLVVLTENGQRKTSEQFQTQFAVNEDHVLRHLSTE